MALAYRHSSRAVLRHVLNLTLERYSHCSRSLHTLGAEDDSLSRSSGQAGTSNSPFPCSATSTIRPLATKGRSTLRYDVEKRSTVTGRTDTPIHAESSRNPHRTGTKLDRSALLDVIMSTPKNHHRNILNRITTYTATLHTTHLTSLSSTELRRIIRNLVSVMRHARPDRWNRRIERPHRSIRMAFVAITRCLAVLAERGDPSGVMEAKEFDLIFYSLARRPFLEQRAAKDDVQGRVVSASTETSPTATTSARAPATSDLFPVFDHDLRTGPIRQGKPMDDLTIQSVLATIKSLSLVPTVESLEHIAAAKSVRLVPTFPHAISRRRALGTTYRSIVLQTAQTWRERLGWMESMCAVQPDFELTGRYEEEVMRTFDEAEVVFAGCDKRGSAGLAVWEELEIELREWRWRLDELVRKKAKVLAPHLKALDELRDGQSCVKVDMVQSALFLLRYSLLSDALQSRTSLPELGLPNGARRDAIDFLRIIIGNPTVSKHNDPPIQVLDQYESGQAEAIGEAVEYLRNTYHVHGQFDKLLNLIHLLSLPSPSSSPIQESSTSPERISQELLPSTTRRLPPNIHSTLLTTATNRDQFRRLILRLVHFPPPASPPNVDYTTRRLILTQARISQDVPWPISDPALSTLPTEMRDILVSSGWVGLVLALFEKWGVGIPQTSWESSEAAELGRDVAGVEKTKEVMARWRRNKPLKVPGTAATINAPLRDPLLARRPRKR